GRSIPPVAWPGWATPTRRCIRALSPCSSAYSIAIGHQPSAVSKKLTADGCDERSKMKVRKAVITAAGRGTRQYPASSTVQKEMFPLVDVDGLTKPTIQIIAEEALDAGIEELCIVTAPGDEEMYRRHFRGLSEDLLPASQGKEWAL